ncbi:carbon-nitrogen hydrolase family protein [Herbaspirillum sp. GCM10030257]|uniref:carbon-nitrogen hydrolase family protein n=1 Tax=Herbaspirillum sp. GCM10030257 TaxID=3273393 RepID=UPI0036207A22
MTTINVGFVQWPENLQVNSEAWDRIAVDVSTARPDVLITNEMPFGPWIACTPDFDRSVAEKSILAHIEGIEALSELNLPLIISSRPVWAGDRLANEAFMVQGTSYSRLHQKHFFPQELGWHEASWFRTEHEGFDTVQASGATLGVLLCTELMFNERARQYGRANADLIAVPRATGRATASWRTACAMAAIVSGSYVVSSNRVGSSEGTPFFGGQGFAFAPDGTLIAETSEKHPLVCFEMDVKISSQQKKEYPCYVLETVNRVQS